MRRILIYGPHTPISQIEWFVNKFPICCNFLEDLNDERICQPGVCGDGECQLTTHISYKFVCKCRDGSYKFEPCAAGILFVNR
jgi:hypothetical protein